MKKLSIIAASLALLAAMTQCKKEEQQTTTSDQNKVVSITLDIKGNGTRMDVNTTTGEVAYETGDVVYVASNGHYVGTLTHNGANFSGAITDPEVGAPLHFYFLGNATPAETLTGGITTTCSVVISDQTERLPVIEYAPSNETYTEGATSFTSHLLNKCALVKFNVTTSSSAATCITGFNNKVTVDFGENTVTPSQDGTGIIKLSAGSGEKWAILLPQDAVDGGEAYSEDGEYSGTYAAVPTVINNGYLTAGIDVTVDTEVNPGEMPTGALSGKFTINESGDQVYFSQGNLQYQASTNTWQFAEHQYDYVGSANSAISQTNSGWIDLFGWGTSGYNHGAYCYQPWSTYTSYSDYYAYGSYNYNLYDQTGYADWGYNAISNGGNTENSGWRTLTQPEWDYVFKTRTMANGGSRYTLGHVEGVLGVVVYPDNYAGTAVSSNLTATGWSEYEAVGCVFLPAAGYRYGSSVGGVGSSGYYWSSSYYDSDYTYYVRFSSDGLGTYREFRFSGFSVRLVCSAQ